MGEFLGRNRRLQLHRLPRADCYGHSRSRPRWSNRRPEQVESRLDRLLGLQSSGVHAQAHVTLCRLSAWLLDAAGKVRPHHHHRGSEKEHHRRELRPSYSAQAQYRLRAALGSAHTAARQEAAPFRRRGHRRLHLPDGRDALHDEGLQLRGHLCGPGNRLLLRQAPQC